MIHEANRNELTLIDKIVRASETEFALVRITETMLSKSTIDANKSIVELMRLYSYFDFNSAIDGEKTYLPIRILTASGWIESVTSLYRPNAKPNKPGDPRLWPRGIVGAVTAGNLLLITINDDHLTLIPLLSDLVTDEILNEEFPTQKLSYLLEIEEEKPSASEAPVSLDRVEDFTSPYRDQLDISLEADTSDTALSSDQNSNVALWLKRVVGKLRDNVDRWLLSCSPQKSNPKDVGDTLEAKFGLKVNNDGTADYHGIELKTKRRKSKTPDTLFSQIPDADLTPLRTAKEIILTYGYPSRKPHREGFTELFVTVSNSPNPQGLYLQVNDDSQTVEMRCTGKEGYNLEDHKVAVWTYEILKERLFEKHPVTAWILASEDEIDGAIHFRYDGLEISKTPVFSQFLLLIERGIVVYDWRGGYHPEGTGRVDKGHAFRLKGAKNRGLLFGELEVISLH